MSRFGARSVWWTPVLLAGALLQTVDCSVKTPPRLNMLVVEAAGDDQIEGFLPQTRRYRVGSSEEGIVVRAEATDEEAVVTYELVAGGVSLEEGVMGTGGGESSLSIPLGRSTLSIDVSTQDLGSRYTVELSRGLRFPCTDQGILDAVAYGGGLHSFDCEGPTTVAMRTEIVASRSYVWLDGEGDLTIESNGFGRVLFVAEGAAVELEGMELTNGRAELGGALYSEGQAILRDVSFVSNRATYRGGAVYCAPGGVLTLDAVTVSDNTAAGTSEAAGGGLYLEACATSMEDSVIENNVARGWSGQGGRRARGGGLFVSDGSLVVKTSRISQNSAVGGDGSGGTNGAGYSRGGGLLLLSSEVAITDSAVDSNVSQGGFATVGGGFATGGGVWLEGGTLSIDGTTIANNLADGVSGPWEAGAAGGLAILGNARLTTVNSTITGNRADFSEAMEIGLGASAAFYNSTIAFNSTDEDHSVVTVRSDSELTLEHTIVANVGRCFGPVQSFGHNVFSPSFVCATEGVGDVTDADPLLQPLADNGGPTMTHTLADDSPARDAGDPTGCVGPDGKPLTHDQRGLPRPTGVCDIGAVEMTQP